MSILYKGNISPHVCITMPPLQHQLKFVVSSDLTNDIWECRNHFLYKVTPPVDVGDRRKEHYSSGEHTPFTGYTTRTGSVEPNGLFIEKDVLLQKIKNLIDVASWTDRAGVNERGEEVISNARQVIAGS